jgi:sporulation protein YlmC with PRC-barrel domain
MRLSDDNLRGRTVISADGQAIGLVTAMFFDSEGWRIEALRVKLRRGMAERLGARSSIFNAGTVDVPVSVVQSVGDAVVLSVGVGHLVQQGPPEQAEVPQAP